MDVKVATIRREYATKGAAWVEVIGVGASLLVALESARLASRGGAWIGLAVVAGGWLATRAISRAIRVAALPGELWRKFGLPAALLEAVRDAGELSREAEVELDLALRDLRGLAAIANHDRWEECAEIAPEALVEQAAAALCVRLAARPVTAEALHPLRASLSVMSATATGLLAALIRDDPDEVGLARAAFVAARQAWLEAWEPGDAP
jgi:hypothetical protein